jgi:inositol-pentakisphosphate 2-kinase
MTNAIHSLWDAWVGSGGVINNLRIFVNGKMVKPDVDGDVSSPLDKMDEPSLKAIVIIRKPLSSRNSRKEVNIR